MENLFKQQLQHCEGLLVKYPHDEVLLKALSSVRSAVAQLPSSPEGTSSWEEQMKEPLRSYTQSVLDSTYHTECQLVSEEFPPNSAQGKIRSITGSLCAPAILCGSPDKARSLLGKELLECLHWRVGALMYMYCHTITTSEAGRKEKIDREHFVECCNVGVGHLKLMLTARTPLQSREDYSTRDPSVAELLQNGIWSDIHMLALMYAGELCYWIWETTQAQAPTHTQTHTQPQSQSLTHAHTETHTQTQLSTVSENVTRCTQDKDREDRHEGRHATCERLQNAASSNGEDSGEPCTAEATSLYSLMENLQGREFVQKWASEFSAVQYGQDFLTKYVDAARGPLMSQGWSYDRAVQLLVKLKKAAQETH